MDHGLITLLLIARGHTASWEQTPSLHYGEACSPVSQLASQPASNSPSEYVIPHTKHQTSNIKIQPTLGHSSVSATPPSRRSHYSLFINRYSINWLIKYIWINESYGSGSGMTRTLFFVVFVNNCYKFGICSPYAKPDVDQCCFGEEFLEHS